MTLLTFNVSLAVIGVLGAVIGMGIIVQQLIHPSLSA
jgi:hypothetical protein